MERTAPTAIERKNINTGTAICFAHARQAALSEEVARDCVAIVAGRIAHGRQDRVQRSHPERVVVRDC
jgi:hypothetical protein